jgi:hypothetical protein
LEGNVSIQKHIWVDFERLWEEIGSPLIEKHDWPFLGDLGPG